MRLMLNFIEILFLRIQAFANTAWIFLQVPLWGYLQDHTPDGPIANLILNLLETVFEWTGISIGEITILSLILSMFPFFVLFTMFRWFRH